VCGDPSGEAEHARRSGPTPRHPGLLQCGARLGIVSARPWRSRYWHYPCAARAGTGVPNTQLWTELDVTGPIATNTTVAGIAKVRVSESLPNVGRACATPDAINALGLTLDVTFK
jgi:hypothetical protein